MEFKNEDTFGIGEALLESSFSKALDEVTSGFSNHNPMRIGGANILSDKEVKVVSPIDRRVVIGYFQLGRAEHALKAIQEAKAAFKKGKENGGWRDYSWTDRVAILERAASVLSRKKFHVAAILSYENGKSRDESIGEVDEAIDFLRYYCYLIRKNEGLIISRTPYKAGKEYAVNEKNEGERFGHQGARSSGERVSIVSKPFGVWSVIAPFNFPVSLSVGMIAAALITGNTVVFKPSFGDNPAPLTGLQIYDVFEEAGLPEGVLNYITGLGGEIGDILVENPEVSGIAFTGSREVAMHIQEKVRGNTGRQQNPNQVKLPKQFVAEMGSKNPVIVTGSADIDRAVQGVISAAFGFCGQKCSAASRAIVHASIYDRFIEAAVAKTRTLRIGDPLRKDIDIGPLIGKSALDRYLVSVDEAKQRGKVICGGHRLEGTDLYDNGCYVEPAIIEVPEGDPLFRSELFMPVLAVLRYNEFDEAIRIANSTEYGLTAGLYSGDGKEIAYFNDNIEFGTIYVNRNVSATTGAVVGQQTFVGWKGSSLSCKGTSSLSYLLQFVREQSQTIVDM